MTEFSSGAQPGLVPAPTSGVPAAWYADPRVPGQLRWFDGSAWTAHVHAVPAPTPGDGYGSVVPWGVAPTRSRVVEAMIPVNRSGLAITAGYVGLFSILLVFAPVALLLGVLALRDLGSKPTVAGRGRAWFAVVAGSLGTAALVAVLFS